MVTQKEGFVSLRPPCRFCINFCSMFCWPDGRWRRRRSAGVLWVWLVAWGVRIVKNCFNCSTFYWRDGALTTPPFGGSARF